MKIGFTGTQAGMTNLQWTRTLFLLRGLEVQADLTVHHGCCLGADADFVRICAVALEEERSITIIAHPSNLQDKTSLEAKQSSNSLRPVKDPLVRNHDIVNNVELMIACPKTKTEELRSGTWATIRYARKQKKHLIIIWPDGTTTEENKP